MTLTHPETITSGPAYLRRVLLRPRIFEQMMILAARDESDLAEKVNLAARLLLEKEGLWPPPPASNVSAVN